MKFDRSKFAARLRELRLTAGLTQGGLGKELGVGNTMIANLESGKFSPSLEVFFGLTEVFKVTAEMLAGETELPPEIKDRPPLWLAQLFASFANLDRSVQKAICALVKALEK